MSSRTTEGRRDLAFGSEYRQTLRSLPSGDAIGQKPASGWLLKTHCEILHFVQDDKPGSSTSGDAPSASLRMLRERDRICLSSRTTEGRRDLGFAVVLSEAKNLALAVVQN